MSCVAVQLLEALKASHRTGIVHRDVKPQNVIISETDNKVKLIDMGAAADLRVGINYVPNEFLLDPRYAPPQQYIMSTQVRLYSFMLRVLICAERIHFCRQYSMLLEMFTYALQCSSALSADRATAA